MTNNEGPSGSTGSSGSAGPSGSADLSGSADAMPNGGPLESTTESGDAPAENGPGTTLGAGTRADEQGGRQFPCPQCGSDLIYTIGELSLHCQHCGFDRPIELGSDEEIEENDYAMALRQIEVQKLRREGEASSEEVLAETVACAACAAQVTFDASVTSLECGYCGTPMQRDRVHLDPDRIPVDAVLPFAVDKKWARRSLKKWVKGLWFAPNKFKKRGVSGSFQGVYLPFWTFDSLTFTKFSGERGDYYYRGQGKNRRRKVRWRSVRGQFQHFFDDVLVLAAQEVRGTELGSKLHQLEPWTLKDCRPFHAEFLAGFQARTYDTKLEDGFKEAHARMKQELNAQVRRRIGGDTQRISQVKLRFDAVTYKHALLPLWLMTYQHKGEDKQVVINARTGVVHGQRPWSVWKILLAVLAALLVVMVLFVL